MPTLTQLGIFRVNDSFYSFRLPSKMMDNLNNLSKNKGVSKSELIRRGIKIVWEIHNGKDYPTEAPKEEVVGG